jgi:hypothetical protein
MKSEADCRNPSSAANLMRFVFITVLFRQSKIVAEARNYVGRAVVSGGPEFKAWRELALG